MIKIYSTPTCIYCKYAKEFFKKNNIEYTDLNVAEDEKAREEFSNIPLIFSEHSYGYTMYVTHMQEPHKWRCA